MAAPARPDQNSCCGVPETALIAVLTARAALATGAAGARDGLVHDAADGPCATPALRAAAQAAIDLAGGSRRPLGRERGANVVVGQYIARTDDHWKPGGPSPFGPLCNYRYMRPFVQAKT